MRYYAERFRTVELNSAFYRLPNRQQFERWADAVPEDFIVAVKASRYLTHVRRLRDPADSVKRLVGVAEGLGSKLGSYLLQLPPNLIFSADDLQATLKAFPRTARVAVEARHPSWSDDRVRRLLERRAAAWVLADPPAVEDAYWRTSDWGYVRFHRGTATPPPCYSRSSLETRARRIADLWGPNDDVYCYFNNDTGGCAPRDARRMALAASRAGLHPTAVPGPRETPLKGRD